MEYKKMMYSDRAKKAEGCCKLGYPSGYYNIGVDIDKCPKGIMKGKGEYHNMNGYQMKGKKHMGGPEGYWGI